MIQPDLSYSKKLSIPDKQHIILMTYKNDDGVIYRAPAACINSSNEKIIHVCSFNYKYCTCVNGYDCFTKYCEVIGG